MFSTGWYNLTKEIWKNIGGLLWNLRPPSWVIVQIERPDAELLLWIRYLDSFQWGSSDVIIPMALPTVTDEGEIMWAHACTHSQPPAGPIQAQSQLICWGDRKNRLISFLNSHTTQKQRIRQGKIRPLAFFPGKRLLSSIRSLRTLCLSSPEQSEL